MEKEALKKGTLRTCVVCKRKTGKENLYRFVIKASGGLLFDKDFKLPGRGAYLHLKRVNEKSSYKLLYSLKENFKSSDARNIDLKKIIGIKAGDSKTGNSKVKKINSIKPIFR